MNFEVGVIAKRQLGNKSGWKVLVDTIAIKRKQTNYNFSRYESMNTSIEIYPGEINVSVTF